MEIGDKGRTTGFKGDSLNLPDPSERVEKAAKVGGQTQTGRKVSFGVERAAHKTREGYLMAITDLRSPEKLILAPSGSKVTYLPSTKVRLSTFPTC